MSYKRILTIQDISCVGQCSMTVALPILSACGHEVCILPSALLSTHTGGFGSPVVKSLTNAMSDIRMHWQRAGINFDIIYTGYLGSIQAIKEAERIMKEMLAPGGLIVVDPAMADHGRLYTGFDEAYASAIKSLCANADVILPNMTEAAMLTGLPYREAYDAAYIQELLSLLGGKYTVLTGIGLEKGRTGAAVYSHAGITFHLHKKVEKSYHGTGDIFAAAFTGALASGKSVPDAAQIAAEFTYKCICRTYEEPAHWYGVKFETELSYLMKKLNA